MFTNIYIGKTKNKKQKKFEILSFDVHQYIGKTKNKKLKNLEILSFNVHQYIGKSKNETYLYFLPISGGKRYIGEEIITCNQTVYMKQHRILARFD